MSMTKFPKTAGAAIDTLWTIREQRRDLDKQVAVLKEQETALEAYISETFFTKEVLALKGRIAQATRSPTTVPGLVDWSAVHAYIKRTGAFELLQKRLSVTAWRERLDAGKPIPGVEAKTVWNLNVKPVKE